MNFRLFIEGYDGEDLLKNVLTHPDDVGLRLIFADWLEDQGYVYLPGLLRGDTHPVNYAKAANEVTQKGSTIAIGGGLGALPFVNAELWLGRGETPTSVRLRPTHRGIEFNLSGSREWRHLPDKINVEKYVPALALLYYQSQYEPGWHQQLGGTIKFLDKYFSQISYLSSQFIRQVEEGKPPSRPQLRTLSHVYENLIDLLGQVSPEGFSQLRAHSNIPERLEYIIEYIEQLNQIFRSANNHQQLRQQDRQLRASMARLGMIADGWFEALGNVPADIAAYMGELAESGDQIIEALRRIQRSTAT